MKKTYRSREELKNYYDRYLYYVKTNLSNGVIETTVQKVKVYNPFNFDVRIAPAEGCDIVIGNSSTNSDRIYDLKKDLYSSTNTFSLNRYKNITLFTYCEENQVEEVKTAHLTEIKNSIEEVKNTLKKEILDLENIKL
jgi:hypothetical protein